MTPDMLTPSSIPPARNRRRVIKFALVLFGACLLAVVLFVTWTATPDRNLIWLTPADLTQSTRPGLLTRFGYQLKNLTAPLWQRFRRNRPQIHIDSDLMIVAPEAAQQAGLGAPVATNAVGLRAWILSPQDLTAFQQRLKSIAGASSVSRPRVLTSDGGPARIGVSASAPSGSSLEVALTPKIVHRSIRLLVGVTATERTGASGSNPGNLRTNLSAACRVLIPNAGGLVISTPSTPDAGGRTYWFIVSPAAIDARGNRINL